VPLAVGTHWPKLQLGTGDMPAPDKLIHLVAFGGLGLLLARSGWLGRWWILAAAAWIIFDEATQAIPGLNRTTSWMDPAAGLLGIGVVAAWGWALAPIGGPANRARLAFLRLAHDSVFARPTTWLWCALAGTAGASAIGAAAWWGLGLRQPDDLFVSLVAGAGAGVHFTLHALTARRRRELARIRACPWCAASGANLRFDAQGCAPCSGCGRSLWIGQWRADLSLPRGRLLRLARRPILAAAAMAAVAAAAWGVAVLAHAAWGIRLASRVPWEIASSVDLAGAGLAAAILVRVGRRQVAAAFDAQHRACLCCGHDVHGSPATAGEGRCAECGRTYHVAPWPNASKPRRAPSRS
jgi:hypothetical protein